MKAFSLTSNWRMSQFLLPKKPPSRSQAGTREGVSKGKKATPCSTQVRRSCRCHSRATTRHELPSAHKPTVPPSTFPFFFLLSETGSCLVYCSCWQAPNWLCLTQDPECCWAYRTLHIFQQGGEAEPWLLRRFLLPFPNRARSIYSASSQTYLVSRG